MEVPKHILITGASRGLGRALAEHFIHRGDFVYGCSRSDQTLDAENYCHFKANISSESDISEMFSKLRKQTKYLDALINNAGIASMNAFALTPLESFTKIFATNVQGTFLCCQKALGLLKKSANPRIINMTTVAVPFQLEGESIYASSKSAVETMTRILAKEYGSFGITCNAIGPSPIATDLIRGVAIDKIQNLVNQQAIKKMATADDVINLADFFLRPESGMISGQIVYLGGVS
ncbi:SDR family NAD(P)-dependent oxidoreductase [Halochromatium roseum]|uniref:SDR family NAD(P)-dependent oxidoreductase n=1 Tax=Halochromatium roseum TaxID=391920 RepID=UPI001914D54F|nr:SDR family oxidoreductase [Halochromatium roseum]MBK5940372.1 oxidoreductase [Halochromatium roseum]